MVNGETPYRAEIPNVQLGRPHMGLRPQMVNRETLHWVRTPYGQPEGPIWGKDPSGQLGDAMLG